ncbi:hypothetical protein [Parachryseolinea silvisoli]|uniref:hypothetical protein n=1 Tax=Parachryseolinea silvisoli TaxID=2873601 RepID=UPI002265E7E3|nr:hypothetical protein [Parachryseolinea silvisoli]MCD9015351.1 hypothetical protein [Parachryseolinea silvisoli]
MTLLYPITRRQWLKNREKGLSNYTLHEVTKAVKRINKKLTFLNKSHDSFLTDSDVVNTTIKRNVYKNAVLLRCILSILFVLLVLAESFINYENMEIFIMPGEIGLRALLMRTVTAFILTVVSIVSMHMVFENAFHHWLESDKIKYNFPDTLEISVSSKVTHHDSSRIAFLIICTAVMLGCLWTIYIFAEKRAAVIEAISLSRTNTTGVSPLTLVSLILPFIGGMTMFVIKRNHNIVAAYNAMTRYRIRLDLDKKRKNHLIDIFSIRRAKTLNEEIALTFRRVNRFKNYLEAINHTLQRKNNKEHPYQVHGLAHTEDQNILKIFILKRLEPETLRLNGEAHSSNT